jgi:hypothetical protein
MNGYFARCALYNSGVVIDLFIELLLESVKVNALTETVGRAETMGPLGPPSLATDSRGSPGRRIRRH